MASMVEALAALQGGGGGAPMGAPVPAGAPTGAAAPSAFASALQNPNIYMALLTGGLSALDTGNLTQGLQTGLGTYQQLYQNEQSEAQRAFDEEMALKQFALSERKVGQGDEALEIDRERLGLDRDKLKMQSQQLKKKLTGKAKPTGVDSKLWTQALDTAALMSEQTGEPVTEAQVRTLYNSMAPENRKVAQLFGRQELGEAIRIIQENPDRTEDYLTLLEDNYGKGARTRVGAVLKTMENAVDVDAAEEEAGEGAGVSVTPPAAITPLPGAASVTTNPYAQDVLKSLYQPNPNSPFSAINQRNF